MKKIAIILLLALLVQVNSKEQQLNSSFHREAKHWCLGTGPKIGISDWGAHFRVLNRDIWGVDISAFRNWDKNGYGGTGEFIFKFPTESPVRPYLALGTGVYRANIDTTFIDPKFGPRKFSTDLTLMHYVGKIGAEARFGEHDKHGISIEAGYQYGKGYYNFRFNKFGSNEQFVEEIPFEVNPLELNLLYTYYFCREKVKDRDGDGILDTADRCPDEPGQVGFYGCNNPDIDGDQVLDPWVTDKGLLVAFREFGSGYDSCVNERGLLENSGCPFNDRDGDGIVDPEDMCPDVPGVVEFNGCPNPDTDGDKFCDPWVSETGLSDQFTGTCQGTDKCPSEPETVNEYQDKDGCPDELPVAQEITREAMVLDGVTFVTGKATLKPESFSVLDKVVESLIAWEEVEIEIQGHTDNVGKAAANLKLSYDRAQSVKEYLISKGINATRMRTVGYGMERPIADNKTAEGRQENRRVTMQKSN